MNEITATVSNLNDIFWEPNCHYVVPLYQREYAWTDKTIQQLLDDLYDSFLSHPKQNYHLGTIVIHQRLNTLTTTYELIDGQQRLTTLSLLARLIEKEDGNKTIPRILFFDNRPQVESFLTEYFRDGSHCAPDPIAFYSAVKCMEHYQHENTSSLKSLLFEENEGITFMDYIKKNTKLFIVKMPQNTDVSAYFEIMNNRGEQLQYHELLKAQLIAKIDSSGIADKEDVKDKFNYFWTAASHMNGHLINHAPETIELNDEKKWNEIKLTSFKKTFDDPSSKYELQSVIDDFPNFLMHVLRIYLNNENIPLDERKMESCYRENLKDIDPIDFLQRLLETRLKFDKFIVKAKFFNERVEKWILEEICHSGKTRKTFEDDEINNTITQLESALQVTYRTRRYKEWLYNVLATRITSGEDLLKTLTVFLQNRLREAITNNSDNWYQLGTATPHVIFNTIDYLLWKKAPNENKNFIFAYRSSIEHHHPQNQYSGNDEWESSYIDNIANLCLVYASENSSMNNHSATEKIGHFTNWDRFSLKRQIMYKETEKNKCWTQEIAKKHFNEINTLITTFLSSN